DAAADEREVWARGERRGVPLLDCRRVERLVERIEPGDLVALGEEPLGEVRADEAGRAGEEDARHRGALPWPRYSRFPAGPRMGDSMGMSGARPSSAAKATIFSTAARRFASSRTTPPFPTSPLPTSNCGLMRAMISEPAARSVTTFGRTS